MSNIKTVGILQPGYLPWLGFFEQLHRCDIFVLYNDVQFERGSWRNRNRIKTSHGKQWLTVPVRLKGKGFPLIKDVRIDSTSRWQTKHIKSIRQSYLKTPYFERYQDELFKILSRPWNYLLDLNLQLISWISEQLNMTTPILLASEFGITGSHIERLIHIIRFLDGNHFYESCGDLEG